MVWIRHLAACSFLLIGLGLSLRAGDSPPPTTNRERQQLREDLKTLPPDQRQARLRELREKYGATPTNALEWEARRRDLNELGPTERETKLREWRESRQGRERKPLALPDSERKARREQLRKRLEAQIAKLRQQPKLTPEDQAHLLRMEEVARRFQQDTAPPSFDARPSSKESDKP